MEKFVCIHGHFYQPPRENPWLESVELQDSAAPYHDWNERITAECYAPNASARILDSENRIAQIVSNYSKISFNFGPTLLTWMKEKTPAIHDAIIEADKLSRKQFSGHGSALAQVYNHVIMPLANRRDKFTQVLWGIRDFESRFGRKPEGLWLSETAVDSESLDVLAELGIKFTILSPHQAAKVRKLGEREWQDCNGGIDPTRPYLAKLKSGREINLFFYDSPVSKAIAFERVLMSGEQFASRLMSAFSDKRDWSQLVHVATDGESYGHHHRFGDMALAYALHHVETQKLARLTNYGEFLETHPPTHEVEIHEESAWSCVHGVGRWKENCGCNSGGFAGWNQNWRAPLRESLNWLRDHLAPLFEKKAAEFFKDPWSARNDYIAVVLDRSPETLEKFFERNSTTNDSASPEPAESPQGFGLRQSSGALDCDAAPESARRLAQSKTQALSDEQKITALKLLEIQRHAMLMFTSCGWFFDELSGIETVQVIQYAARAIQLAKEVFNKDLEPEFLNLLEKAKSNIAEYADGRVIYGKFVKPAMVDFEKVVAHYAISSVFETYSDRTKIFLYSFEDENRELDSAGRAKLGIGTARVTFDITRESATLSYAVLFMGEHNLTCGVRAFASAKQREKMAADLKESFSRADFPETIRRLDHHFGGATYSLKSLFKDEQRKILDQILVSTRDDLEEHFRNIAGRYTPLMRFLRDIGAPLLPAMRTVSDFILHVDICRQFDSDAPDFDELRSLIEEAHASRHGGMNLFDADLAFVIKSRMEAMIERLAAKPDDLTLLQNLIGIATVAKPLPLELNLWKVQNTYWEMLQRILPRLREKAKQDDEQTRGWVEKLFALGEQLGFAVTPLRPN